MMSMWIVIGIWIGALALVGLALGIVMAIEGVRCARSVVRRGKRADRRILAPLWGAVVTARKVAGGHALRARDWRAVRAVLVALGGAVALVALGAVPVVTLIPLWYVGTVVYHAGAQLRRIWVRSLRSDRRALVAGALGTLAALLFAGALGAGSGAMLASVPLLALPYRRAERGAVAALLHWEAGRPERWARAHGAMVRVQDAQIGAPTPVVIRLGR